MANAEHSKALERGRLLLGTIPAYLSIVGLIFGIFFGLYIGNLWVSRLHSSTPLLVVSGACVLLFGILFWSLGWVWWSWHAPRWRLWALEASVDKNALIKEAVRRRFLWPKGHWAERTEFRWPGYEERLKKLLQQSAD